MSHKAFTLAEVLITLGIIGVVAAMTLPAVIANSRKHEVVTKLEKIYSVMNQAINMSISEYGDVTFWAEDCGNSSAPTCTVEQSMEWFNKYIGKHLQIIRTVNSDDGNGFYVYFKDGSILLVRRCLYDMFVYINEKALANKQRGINEFMFRFNPVLLAGQDYERNKYTLKPTFEPYSWSWNGTREGLINAGNGFGCMETNRAYCTKLIQYDGWKINSDYPLKF